MTTIQPFKFYTQLIITAVMGLAGARERLRCFDTVFRRPYRYFSIALKLKWFYRCLIAVKFSSVIDYRLKFVKM